MIIEKIYLSLSHCKFCILKFSAVAFAVVLSAIDNSKYHRSVKETFIKSAANIGYHYSSNIIKFLRVNLKNLLILKIKKKVNY